MRVIRFVFPACRRMGFVHGRLGLSPGPQGFPKSAPTTASLLFSLSWLEWWQLRAPSQTGPGFPRGRCFSSSVPRLLSNRSGGISLLLEEELV